MSNTIARLISFTFCVMFAAVQVTGQEYVEKGEAVHLICNATGKPDPPHDVEWYKDGEKINSGT